MAIDPKDPHFLASTRFGLGSHAADNMAVRGPAALFDQLGRYDAKPAVIAALPTREAAVESVQTSMKIRRMVQSGEGPPRPAANQAMSDTAMTDGGMSDGRPDRSMSQKSAMPKQDYSTEDKDLVREATSAVREHYRSAVQARFAACLTTPAPFAERLVHFWSNHFAVSIEKLPVVATAGLLEIEAVRPNITGKFGAMLQAVERHPAMLFFLDQVQSIGPNSVLGARIAAGGRRKLGLNENLAREILELHTLGVRTGGQQKGGSSTVYTQADVTEFARAMTGFTVAGLVQGPMARTIGMDAAPGQFQFVANLHEPGGRQIMGRRYDQTGEAQVTAILNDLAVHPATARHLSFKLARHFVADDPPPALVDRLTKAYLQSGGDLPTWYRALLSAPESWQPAQAKYKTPWEWTVSTARAAGLQTPPGLRIVQMLDQLGQPVWKPGSPAGYDDVADSWLGPDALLRRVEAAPRILSLAPKPLDPRTLAPALLGAQLRPDTVTAISRAESPAQAMALLTLSPEFLRR
jgi:uncharacterized protein (DUF1800 family)